MTEYEVKVPSESDLSTAERTIETACEAVKLKPTLKSTLRKYPGCVHWHFKKENERGTLEMTLWPEKRRIWFSIQARRSGEWMAEAIRELKQALENELLS